MDKIREEFEKFKSSQSPDYVQYVINPADLWSTHFHTFKVGYESRDEEIKIADDTIHKQYIIYSKNQKEIKKLKNHDEITKNYTTELIIKNGRHQAENKKLRDALEWIIDEAQRQREGEGGDLRTIKHFAEQALKDGE